MRVSHAFAARDMRTSHTNGTFVSRNLPGFFIFNYSHCLCLLCKLTAKTKRMSKDYNPSSQINQHLSSNQPPQQEVFSLTIAMRQHYIWVSYQRKFSPRILESVQLDSLSSKGTLGECSKAAKARAVRW
jgi:hypothetical protein